MSNAAARRRRANNNNNNNRNNNNNNRFDSETGLNPAYVMRSFTAAPQTAHLRWISLLLLSLAVAATVSVYGVGMARDNRAIGRVDSDIARANINLDFLETLIANFTGAPNCTVEGNITITSNFSDAAFGIFYDLDSTAEFAFELSGLDPSSLISLTIQDSSGTVAYLSDIPGITSVFQDDEFTVQNAGTPSREIRLFVGGVSPVTTQVMTVQNVSGTVAYLNDITLSSVFDDDVFAVQSVIDNSREVMLFVGNVSASTTIVMTVQDASGTIAYLSDIVSGGSVFLDSVFGVFDGADPTKLVMLNCSFIMGSTLQIMTVQDKDGTIAYLTDIPQIIEVFLNTSRSFPDMANEGTTTLAGLGSLAYIEISLCGGGGAAGTVSDSGPGGGGGSGSGHENFKVYDPTTKFIAFNCSLGSGGLFLVFPADWGEDGNTTSVIGFSSTDHFLELFGYGGGGGSQGRNFGSGGSPGGAGGGGGGPANEDVPGIAGTEGGLIGGLGGIDAPFVNHTNAVRGGINLSWRSGGGGNGGQTDSLPAAWQGGAGFVAAECDGITSNTCGAASMFGRGSSFSTEFAAPCAGGGRPLGATIANQSGGDGAVLFRYLIL